MRKKTCRRSFLLLTGTGFAVSLAGCIGAEDDEDEPDVDEEEEEEEETEPESEYVDEVDAQVELVYGDTAHLSNGVEVTIHGIEVEEELDHEVPEEREAFAFAEIEAYNGSDAEARLPAVTYPGIELLYEDQQVEPVLRSAMFEDTDYEHYIGGDVQPDVRREGHILYEVDSGLSESDIDFLWQDEIFVAEELDGVIDVRWTVGG